MGGVPSRADNPIATRPVAATLGSQCRYPTEMKEILKLSHLRIVVPPAEYILAMKCLAARVGLDEHDKEDAKFLIQYLGLANAPSVLEGVEKSYPKERIPAKTQYFIQEICDETLSKSKDPG